MASSKKGQLQSKASPQPAPNLGISATETEETDNESDIDSPAAMNPRTRKYWQRHSAYRSIASISSTKAPPGGMMFPPNVGVLGGMISASSRESGEQREHSTPPVLAINESTTSKLNAFRTRLFTALILITLFFVILAAGHFYCLLLVIFLSAGVYWEVISLKRKLEKDTRLPHFFLLRWYWFVTFILLVGIPFVIDRIPDASSSDLGHTLLKYHSMIFYCAAFFGFVWFILMLRRFTLKYQFSQLGMMLVTLLLVVGQSLLHVSNLYHGLLWFLLPAALVVVNDISAYLFGLFFGRTPLINVSPKKTVEGFLGASVITMIFGVCVTTWLQQYKVFICPQKEIVLTPFVMWTELDCKPSKEFEYFFLEAPRIVWYFLRFFLNTTPPIVTNQTSTSMAAAFLRSVSPPFDMTTPPSIGLGRSLIMNDIHKLTAASLEGDGTASLPTLISTVFPGGGHAPHHFSPISPPSSLGGVSSSWFSAIFETVFFWGSSGGLGDVAGGYYSQFFPSFLRLQVADFVKTWFFVSKGGGYGIWITPMMIHALILGFFAAFFAPFGGFFASAFKRALRIKDFGGSFPGHGGITDRFDCQIIMGVFTFFYISTFISGALVSSGLKGILKGLNGLSHAELLVVQQELIKLLEAGGGVGRVGGVA